jgi:tetratricopeptide (TPR) repeat protein
MKSNTARHVRYAEGYVTLGLLNEASDELEAIDFADRFLPTVLAARVDLHMEAKHWDIVIGVGRELTSRAPDLERGWIGWAYALRELGRIAEAKAVLLEADPRHGANSATLNYNLACYHCLLGEMAEARTRLSIACKMHPDFKKDAIDDRDLERMWNDQPSSPACE